VKGTKENGRRGVEEAEGRTEQEEFASTM